MSLQVPVDKLRPFPHPEEPKARQVPCFGRVEAPAVILHHQRDGRGSELQANADHLGLGVLPGVVHRFLGQAKQGYFLIQIQSDLFSQDHQLHRQTKPIPEVLQVARWREPGLSHPGPWAKVEDDAFEFSQTALAVFFRFAQLFDGLVNVLVQQLRISPSGGPDWLGLGRSVVDLPGHPPLFLLVDDSGGHFVFCSVGQHLACASKSP